MVSEIELLYAESMHVLVQTMTPEFLLLQNKEQELDQCFKFILSSGWVNLARAQDKGLRFWQTRSNAVIVNNSVPSHCIYKVVSQERERTSFETLATPRPPPKVVLKVLAKCSSSSKTRLKVHLPAAGNSLRKFW